MTRPIVSLNEQQWLWELWKVQRLNGTEAMQTWEGELAGWNGKAPLDGDLWARLLDWGKENALV